ncbi:hypothetical protein B7P43_CG14071 [Cryptotermes secundus]|uniref:Parvovirus non-structural protein 1 helicase domain-containing protein n=1 Tax=Cryptotermes secundus TaxID=105785 RepID=A0A2J7RSA2_9NEOP|nr:uncharacterized protein LOC111875661 [Cryptotermes secundus]PNF43721.1 hypothetical protein B7P43_CG14071 [Cryptotermes secundus]PNF43722.1 hypothetical protein B7P43_CG14071 [Cryptotermes secundus]
MDKPNNSQDIMAIFHNTNRQDNQPSPPTIPAICDKPNTDNTDSPFLLQRLCQRQSPTDNSTRTPIHIDISSPTLGSDKQQRTGILVHPLTDEHIVENPSPKIIHEGDRCARNQSQNYDDTGRKRSPTADSIRDRTHRRRSVSPPPIKRTKRSSQKGPANSSLSPPRPTSSSTFPTPPTSYTSTLSGSDYPDGGDSTNPSSSYTFILHRRTFDALPPTSRRSPSFAAFDHGDHIHIIFTVNHSNNSSRHLSTILKFLKVNIEGITEAHSSLQLIRYITRFISYLIRKGLGSFYKYGNRIIPILKPLTDALLHYDVTDQPTTSHLACEQYVEQKKQASKEAITQCTFSIDYISSLITENKITSYESFQRTLPTETKIQLLKQLGYVGQNIIKTLIKIHTIEALQTIKTKHYYQLIIDSLDLSLVQPSNVTWLTRLFSSNAIPVEEFFAKFLIIHSTNITKINTFVVQGPTNTGKSLILNLLLSDTKPTRIARERDKSNFHLDQLPNSTAVLFEEPIIDQTTIGTWKLLLEGSPIPTDMKHSDKEIIMILTKITALLG